jgi:hypothetical protein
LLVVPSGPVDWLPEVALTPDQAPVAEQDVVSVEDQVIVELSPLVTDAGFATMTTSGNIGRVSVPPSPLSAGASVSAALHAASAKANTATRSVSARNVWILTP